MVSPESFVMNQKALTDEFVRNKTPVVLKVPAGRPKDTRKIKGLVPEWLFSTAFS